MKAHAFGNTVDNDLWGEVQAAAGKPVLDVEHDFTRQEGLPLVSVSPSGRGLSLAQSRFADDPRNNGDLFRLAHDDRPSDRRVVDIAEHNLRAGRPELYHRGRLHTDDGWADEPHRQLRHRHRIGRGRRQDIGDRRRRHEIGDAQFGRRQLVQLFPGRDAE